MSLLLNMLALLFPYRRRGGDPFDPFDPCLSPEQVFAGIERMSLHNERSTQEQEAKEQRRQEASEFLRRGAETGRKLAQQAVAGSVNGRSHDDFTAALMELRDREAESWKALINLAGHMYGERLVTQILDGEFGQHWYFISGNAHRLS